MTIPTDKKPVGVQTYKGKTDAGWYYEIVVNWDLFTSYANANADEIFFDVHGFNSEWYVAFRDITELELEVNNKASNAELYVYQDYPTQEFSGSAGTLSGSQILGNNIPAEYSGIIESLYVFSPGKPFNVLVCRNVGGNAFKLISRTRVVPPKQYFSEIVTNIPIEKGDFVFFEQTQDIEPQNIPYFGTNAQYAEQYTKGWWQTGSMELNETKTLGYVATGEVSAYYKIKAYKFVVQEDIQTRTIVVERNAENYNSIRNLLKTLNPSYYNRYIIKVPKG